MDHDLGVRKSHSLALCTTCKKECTHAGSHTDADGGNIALDVLHCIVNSHTCGNRSAGAVDVEIDVLIGILRLKEKHLSNDKARGNVINLFREENDTIL